VRAAAWAALRERGFVPAGARQLTLAAMAERSLDALVRDPEHADAPTLEAGLSLGGQVFRTEVLGALERLPRRAGGTSTPAWRRRSRWRG
jgi:hypothetical protein